jgi:hypothetical protein
VCPTSNIYYGTFYPFFVNIHFWLQVSIMYCQKCIKFSSHAPNILDRDVNKERHGLLKRYNGGGGDILHICAMEGNY